VLGELRTKAHSGRASVPISDGVADTLFPSKRRTLRPYQGRIKAPETSTPDGHPGRRPLISINGAQHHAGLDGPPLSVDCVVRGKKMELAAVEPENHRTLYTFRCPSGHFKNSPCRSSHIPETPAANCWLRRSRVPGALSQLRHRPETLAICPTL
jgi:hypothetical protein